VSASRITLDGRPATADDLARMAMVNYGAYTSFRVEGGAVRGLSLHLERLEHSALELFGESPGPALLHRRIVEAVTGRDQAWVRISLHAPQISHRHVTYRGAPQIMVAVFDPPPALSPATGTGFRLFPLTYERERPHLKHLATFGLIAARREAQARGFDDALFLTREGQISEGTLWNIGFVRGDTVIWPEAPMLDGVTRRLIHQGLARAGLGATSAAVRLEGLGAFDHAFLCNAATPCAPIAAIGDHAFARDDAVTERIVAAFAHQPPEPLG
jgi:branched-subunit amino acid aminotransferase/4-amino-4-deoxychorismate lyase